MIMEEGKRWLGKASFTVLSVMFLMSWFELNVFDVPGWVLLIGFVGKKLKDSGYDWTAYDWNLRDPLEVELLGYGFILLILYFHLFMFFIRLQPILTLLMTGVIADTLKTHFDSWDAVKAFVRR
ncbi:hypothetical protein CDAR_580631 [Caerostris darwini]|uniref:Uncharacterized protein n=1 Tax=Caerostris darwini TaxID=1538125 RepID=A0AAV4R418_9ARAC|nr:hypothetical protein CDAR_580631 [Caerostris darwini]